MKLDHIHEFVILAKSGNYLQAAETLFISQSTLSKHIKSLETDLGTPLFDRTTRKVKLNSFGQTLLPYAIKLDELYTECSAALSSQLQDSNSRLTIASIPVMTQYHIYDVLSAFQTKTPHVKLDIIEGDTVQSVEMLRNETCDFAFLREFEDTEHELNTITFDTDHMVAVLPTSHPLAKKPFVTLEQLKEERFILLNKGTLMYNLCISSCQDAGFTPDISFTSHRAANIMDLVKRGMGIALLTKKPTLSYAGPDIALVDIVPYINTAIQLAYVKDRKPSTAGKQFLAFVQSWVQGDGGCE